MSNDVSGLTIFLAIAAPVAGLIGVMLGLLSSRGREVRDMRRRAYVDWLTAGQNLGFLSDNPDDEGSWGLVIPKELVRRVNDMQAEVAVVASRRVLAATSDFLGVVESADYTKAMVSSKDERERLGRHIDMTKSARRSVVKAMRKDMLPLWRWRSRQYPVAVLEVS
jgi:hypothetical protein